MPVIKGQYARIKEPRLDFSFSASYEAGEVISWAADVFRGSTLIGKPNGRIELAGLTPRLYERAVMIAVTASIENGISMHA